MADERKECIENTIKKNKNSIHNIDESFYADMGGVAQAVGQLKEALGKVEKYLNQREFEQASDLGYSDVSSEFIFLQRCLGGLNDTVMQKEILVQEICIELANELDNIKYEEVSPFVEKEMESLKTVSKPTTIEISLGKETINKLRSIQSIRHTPVEYLAELIVASAMQNDEEHWQALEKDKTPIANIKTENKKYYSVDEVSSQIQALIEQEAERQNNLY